jgi:DNA-binding transcriptional LysR family regulator
VPSSNPSRGQGAARPALDLTQLRYFRTVARCGSLTQAARLLQVSQPTLTVAIRQLEERLHTTLLLRDRSGVSLSATGAELLRSCDEIFLLLDRTEQRIQGLEAEDAGSFTLGCHESLGAYFLPRLMRHLLTETPLLEVTLWNGTSAAVRQAVLDRQVHFGVVVNPVPHPDLVLVELFRDAVDLFVEQGAAPDPDGDEEGLARARAQIKKGPLIYAGRVKQCQELIGRLHAEDLLPVRMLSCGDLELVKSLALSGLGVALLPRRVAAYGHKGRLRRLHPALPFIEDTIYLIYRGDLHRTRAALLLKEAIVQHGRRIDEP